MTHLEQTILDTKINGLTVKIAIGFIGSLVTCICVVLACYYGLKEDVALVKKDVATLQQQVAELKQQKQYTITKN